VTPAETLAKAKQLDGFLGKAVKEIKAMNKFAELASKIKANQEAMNAEADDLSVDADKTMSLFMASASKYRAMLDEAKAGVKAMEEAAAAMAGHNGGPLEDLQPVSQPLPPASEPAEPEPAPVVEKAPEPAPDEAKRLEVNPFQNEPPAAEPAPTPLPVLDPTATGNPPA